MTFQTLLATFVLSKATSDFSDIVKDFTGLGQDNWKNNPFSQPYFTLITITWQNFKKLNIFLLEMTYYEDGDNSVELIENKVWFWLGM